MKTIEAVQTTTAAPEQVWALIADAARWSEWGSWTESGVEGGGEQGPDAVRVLYRKPYRVRERITEWEPGRRMGYELVDGMKVTGYRSTLELEPAEDGGTRIRWRSSYERAGLVTGLILRTAIPDACKRLARAAAAQPPLNPAGAQPTT